MFVFVNAFILRQTASAVAVAWYNLGLFITIPIAFLLNGILMKYKTIQFWHWVGLIGQALTALALLWWKVTGIGEIFLFGLLQGIPMGLYWSNRNFLILDTTDDANRTYYVGLEMVITTLASVVMPVIVGFVIKSSEVTNLYTVNQAYLSMGIVALVLTTYGGWRLAGLTIKQPRPKALILRNISPSWWLVRLSEVLYGVQNGFDLFVVPIIVFTFLGKEGTLGLAQSAAALISSVGLYILARKIRPNQRVTVLFRSIVGLTVLTLVFVGVFQREVAFIYIVLISTFAHLNWLARNPIANKAIEDQEGGDSTNNYAYVCDREILLNTGRIIGVMLFFGLNWSLGEQTALRLALLVAVGCQLALVVTVKKLTKLLT